MSPLSTPSRNASPPSISAIRTWLAILVLGVAAFTMVTTEFAPIGLLTQIAADLGRDPGDIGLAVTLYAWIGAAVGLACAPIMIRLPRRPLLVGLILVIAASNVAAMLSETFGALLWARALGAIGHGCFWAIASATAAQIAPPNRTGLSTAIVFGGISLAIVMGVPLVNLVGQATTWRIAFGAIGVIGVLTAALMIPLIPKMQISLPTSRNAFGDVLRHRGLLKLFVITALMTTAHFSAYTFVEPFIRKIPGISYIAAAVLLFGFGIAGFLGNVAMGLLIDRFMKTVITTSLSAMCLALVALGWFGPSLGMGPVLILLGLWGASVAALFGGLQTGVLRLAGKSAIPASAVHSAILNAAIGVGAIVGAQLLALSSISGVMLAAGVATMLPLLIYLVPSRERSTKTS